MKIAVLGFGTVGSGIYDICENNREKIISDFGEGIEIKHILDLRSFPDHPLCDRVTQDIDKILSDPEVETVCETMGGVDFAYEVSMKALRAGKNVVTSNKAVVAAKGPDLLKTATENNVRYLFEASVGGGIPIIRPLRDSLCGNVVTEIDGILNGTCNYIMTGMQTGRFDDMAGAIKNAQELGYAEKDPTEDVEAIDAARKICILAACVTGKLVPYEKIIRKGITGVTKADTEKAAAGDCSVKLIGRFIRDEDGKLYISVCPSFVSNSEPLAHVSGVYNAVLVRGNAVENLMFYGSGAGKLPTASAVVADICETVKYRGKDPDNYSFEYAPDALSFALPKHSLKSISAF